jgi:hypothetical protein
MRHFGKIPCCFTPIILALVLNLSAHAQTPVYHPGQKLIIKISFDGPDADKITGADFNFGLPGGSAPSQPGFSNAMFSNESKPTTAPHTFEITFNIPDIQASGEYHLSQIRATFNSPSVTLLYSGDELPARVVKIDNPKTLTKPKLKDVEVR